MKRTTQSQSGKHPARTLLVLLIVLWSIEPAFAAATSGKVRVNMSEAVSVITTNISKMAIADPNIADVVLLSETEISVIGKKPGVTTLTISHTGTMPTDTYQVEVGNTSMATTFRELLEQPAVTVREIGDSIILEGQVEDELQLARVLQLADACKMKAVNLIEVKKPRQIIIRTRVAEVKTEMAKKVGFKWFGPAGELQYAMDFKAIDASVLPIPHGFLQPKSSTGDTVPKSFAQSVSIDIILQLLLENNYARLLAEPTLITKSGNEASFLVGEERPIVQTLPNSVTVDYKKVGVNMKIKPTADSKNRIHTIIHAEVSQVIGLTPQYDIPIIGTKTADTTLQVNDGQTIVIGGLLENNLSRDALRKVPWLSDIPLFGYLFRHRERDLSQREVLFFMTPSVMKDIDAETAAAPRTPFMRQWNNMKANENVLEIPKKDEPRTLSLKGAPEEPKEPASAKKPPTTNFGPATSTTK